MTEGQAIYKRQNITKELLSEANEELYLDIIDISDPNDPRIYENSQWIKLQHFD